MNATATLYGGLDLHRDNTFCSILDAEKRVVFEKKLANEIETICQALEPFRARIKKLAVESTYNWYWLVDRLKRENYDVRLANPAQMKENIGLKHANDKTDARFIARQLAHDCLPEGHVYPEETRGVRDLLRHRMRLVQDRSTVLQRLTGLCARQTGQELGGREILARNFDELFHHHAPSVRMAETGRRQAEFLDNEIKAMEKDILKDLPDPAAYARLMTIPGIGETLARCILLETGPVTRFPSAGDYASYCRAVPSEHTSNGKKKGEGNRKCGNAYLAWAFVEAANFAVRHDPAIKAWFQRKLARSKQPRVVAVKALANKLAKACYFVLRDDAPFEVARLVGGGGNT